MPDLSDTIEEQAEKPRSASTGAVSASAHSLPDLIAADEYLKANAAVESQKRGFVLQKFKPPGAV